MSHIQIRRPHQLGLEAARKIAFAWAEKAEQKLDMECTYEEGDDQDTVHFTRAGVNGTLQVYPDLFELDARLGFLVSAFRHRIETELHTQFDALLAPAKPKSTGRKKAG
ncbi:MAG: polyhydroxyalkanoic acid system family protein [Comamonadaceae bacterium]|nr:polyhydroxyalkanoic acid system family protein [Comamonadaceae bacterium]